MTNKQLYNLVFENYIQAKRELIKEGYRKESFKNVDFNEVFNKTKAVMQEEKIKSLKRENEMLRKRLQKEGLLGNIAGTGEYESGGAGSETVWNFITNIASKYSITAMADKIAKELKTKNILKDNDDISKFKIKFINFRKEGLNDDVAIRKAMSELKAQNAPTSLAESKKRRRY